MSKATKRGQQRISVLVRVGISAILAALPIFTCFGQTLDGLPAPQKPLRERLLERALKGDAEAAFDLGRNYETGRIGLPRDLSQAQHWYLQAASQGEPFAEASLGILFNFGKGVKRDYLQAYTWYERSVSHLTGGDRDSVAEMRDRVAAKLTPGQLAEAQRMAREWRAGPGKQ